MVKDFVYFTFPALTGFLQIKGRFEVGTGTSFSVPYAAAVAANILVFSEAKTPGSLKKQGKKSL